ncbi:MAG TPA: sialate O-acetylesterase [Luteibacter sp.]|jgi:sialate O-acetylesterase|nr:sialate O-acetylesterase [Luteibacter sp.]
MKSLQWLGLALLACAPLAAEAKLELPLLFTDGAVLQRDTPIRVWGWSTPGATVTLGFDGGKATAKAGSDGRWQAEFPARKAGGPFALSVDDGSEKRDIKNVVVGDVFLCSGQSNMEFMVHQGRDAAKEIASASDPMVRHFKIPNSASAEPEDRLAGGSWKVANPQNVGDFSGACWFFARDIRAKYPNVPIGLINSSWGGSNIEAWMNAETTHANVPDIVAHVRELEEKERVATDATRKHLAAWPEAGRVEKTDAKGTPLWAAEHIDETQWVPIAVPAYWETVGFYGMDGLAWYRTSFDLSAAEAAQGVTLGLAMIDDSDRSFVNGRLIGATDAKWDGVRVYKVPAGALHAGRNSLAIRVDDLGAGGGIHGDAVTLFVQTAGGARRPFTAPWVFRPGVVTISALDGRNHVATLLYNKMIHPLLPYPLRGVLWYQGEENASAGEAIRYRDQFAAMIHQWQADWKQPDLPFVWVQLANWKTDKDTATESPWAELRESQSATLKLPHTAQAVIIDIGDPDNIHPTNKQDVGHRLALGVRHAVYGETLAYSGPTYSAVSFDGAKATLRFDLYGSTLAVRGGGTGVAGFEVAGSDHVFHPAHAYIDGDRVIVSSDVAEPAIVRYAWSDNPVEANLVNAGGLPASPFRTATW